MNIRYILSAFVGGALMLGATACTDEVEFSPADQVAGEGFYLTDTGSASVSIEENATSVSIPVYRTNAEGGATVSLRSSIVDEDGNTVTDIFTVPAEVTFADGATVAELNVGVDFSKIEALMEYDLTLTLLTDQTTPYALSECVYTLSYAPWTPWYYYSTTDPGFYQQATLWSYGYDCPVYIRYSLVDKTMIQIGVPSPFSDLDYTYEITLDVKPENLYNPDNLPNEDLAYIESLGEDDDIDITKLKMNYYVYTNRVNTTVVNTNYNKEMWFTDSYNYWTAVRGLSKADAIAEIEAQGQFRSYFNPTVGKFTLCVVPYIEDLGFFPSLVGTETLQLPGNFKDYSIALNYAGNFVDNNGNESAVIRISYSQDVKAYAYKVINGKLSAEDVQVEVQNIINDPETELLVEGNEIALTLEEGTYTVVAVGYDAERLPVCNTSVSFTYQSVQKENPWNSLGLCEYTDYFFSMFEGLGGDIWEVEIQESKETPGLYRLVNPYRSYVELGPSELLDGDFYITIDATDPQGVWIPLSAMGCNVNPSLGDMYAWSDAGYEIEESGNTLAACKQAGICGTLEDGIITFPPKGLLTLFAATGQAYFANTEEAVLVDMSFIGARAPQKAAANRSRRMHGPLTLTNAERKAGTFARPSVGSGKVISHDEFVKYALRNVAM